MAKKKQRWDDKLSVEENLRERLPRMARKWFRLGTAAMQPGVGWEEMHDFRLLTKRFRYTLETFQPLYGPSLDVRIKQLRNLQTYLGEVNDAITTQTLAGSEAGAQEVVAQLQERADRKREELRRFWARTFEGEGKVAAWATYLARYAGRRKAA